MATVVSLGAQSGFVRHSCGEMNPAEAHYCGGCGADLIDGFSCPSCSYVGTPGARFCHVCGSRLHQTAAATGDSNLEARVLAVEEEFAAMRDDIQSLLVLKEQLDGALKRVRQRQGGPQPPSKPTSSKASTRPSSAIDDAPAATSSDGAPLNAPEAPSAENADADQPSAPTVRSVAVIHVEDRPDLQDTVHAAIEPFAAATYHPETILSEGIPDGRPLLVLNLLSPDPLATATTPEILLKGGRCFAYATDGSRGFILGVTEFFPPPFDADACATRLLSVLPATPRILLVSEAVLGTPELRAHLVRQGCTTSVAFDDRQALGIIPSVRPNLVLIDLNLPRGEGFRVAARIRADQASSHVRVAFMWQQAIEPALVKQYVTRATLDFQFSKDELKRTLLQEFNPGGAAHIAAR